MKAPLVHRAAARHQGTAYLHLRELTELFESRKPAIRSRLRDFSSVPPDQYFYELAYCLLTPQSSAANAAKAIGTLQSRGFFVEGCDASPVLRDRRHYIRFHNTKARHLQIARSTFPVIAAMLSNGATGPELRRWLVENVKGLGWKEASHFLRNIGFRDLAILDRHILKNLKRHRVIRMIPKSLTPKRYLRIEARFQAFASAVGISMDELDLLFWSLETGEILK